MFVTGIIENSEFSFTQAVTVDFNRLEGSLRDAAVEISEESILNQNYRLRRSLRYQRENEINSNKDNNYYQFQMKCTDLQNAIEYVVNLKRSLQMLHNVTSSSVNNVKKSKQELADMIDYYTNEYNKPVTINITMLREAFNIPINTTEMKTNETIETYAGLSNEEQQNLNILKEHLNISDDIEIDVGVIFLKWQHKMQELHNITSSAAGHNCIGFTDCLQKVASVTEDILMDSPRDISNAILLRFPSASHDLIDLSLLQNGSLEFAIQAVANFINLISNERLISYWCTKLPVILDKSDRRINPLENTTIELFCKANSTDYTTYKWKKDGIELLHQRNSTFKLRNVKLHDDSGNYTCEITNQVGTVGSTGTVVDVQQLPWFFLQPENVNSYIGDENDAIFKTNATGWPYPGFKWFFECLGCSNYTQILNEDENELVISNPQAHHEGLYYCEAVNEQGSVKSRVVNFALLNVTVLQLSQSFSINLTSILFDGSGSGKESERLEDGSDSGKESERLEDGSGSGKESERLENGSGSGNKTAKLEDRNGSDNKAVELEEAVESTSMGMSSGSDASDTDKDNVSMTEMLDNSGLLHSKLDIEYAKDQLKNTLFRVINFTLNTIENISISNISSNTISISFTIYSENLTYSTLNSLSRRSLQARIDWIQVSEKVYELLTTIGIALTFGDTAYISEPNSTIVSLPQYTCPPGKEVSSTKNFLCGELFIKNYRYTVLRYM